HRLHEQLLVSPAATVGSHSLDWPPRVMAMSRQRTGPGGVAPTQLPPLGLLKLSVKSAASVVVPRPVKVMAEAAPELTTTPLFPAPSAKDQIGRASCRERVELPASWSPWIYAVLCW